MSVKDELTKDFMSQNSVFAEFINYSIHNGEELIEPENLQELDSVHITSLLNKMEESGDITPKTVKRTRDIIKRSVIKSDGNNTYVIFGVENQTNIDYTMPLRNLLYDTLYYFHQIDEIADRHSKEGVKLKAGGEFLSKFKKEDKLNPVITTVAYFGTKQWDGPLTITDMLNIVDERYLEYIPRYRMPLIELSRLNREDIMSFNTELREVCGFLKYSKDKNGLQKFFEDNPRKTISAKGYNLINEITNSGMKPLEGDEEIDMCKAIEDIREEGKNEGRDEERFSLLVELVNEGSIDVDKTLEKLHMSLDEFYKKKTEYEKGN